MQQWARHLQVGSRLHLESTSIPDFSGDENDDNVYSIHRAIQHTRYMTQPCPKACPY